VRVCRDQARRVLDSVLSTCPPIDCIFDSIIVTDYPRKYFYQDKAVAESYYGERFTHRRGMQRDRALRKALARAFQSVPGVRTVLDLPCGTGRFTEFFCERDLAYFGTDIACEMLEVLARDHPARNLQSRLIRCDGEFLPFKDDAFDCVVSIRLFQLIPPEAKLAILKEMRRVSKQWLIVERMYAQSMRDFGRARYLLCKLLGREHALPVLDHEIVEAGWREFKRIPLKGMKNWVGIYRKTDP
jgi:SAM-dependent methyltransferase